MYFYNVSAPEELCSSEPVVGLCDAIFPRYYYNRTAQKCELYNYGGCGGNGNRFRKEKSCNEFCKGV